MLKKWLIFGLLLFGGFDGSRAVSAGATLKPDNSKDIVFVGTVMKIYPVAGLRKNWAVVVHVDRVASGEFSGTTFTFTIHSPWMAGCVLAGPMQSMPSGPTEDTLSMN